MDTDHPYGTAGSARSEHERVHIEPTPQVREKVYADCSRIDAAYLALAEAIHGWQVTL